MPQTKNRDFFYVDSSHVTNGVLKLTGGEAHHIQNVFRKKKGDIIWAVNGEGTAYETNIVAFGDDAVTCTIAKTFPEYNEPEIKLKLGLGILKSSHVEEVLNSCIQLGLTELVPLNSSRSEKKSLNRARLEKIAIAAMKQCGRSRLTKISDPTGLTQFVSDSSGDDLKLIGVMDRRVPSLNTLLNGLNGVLVKNVSVLIGPEGDFTEDEIETALNSGFKAVSLGIRRLRSETASTVIVSQVMAHYDGRTAE